MEAFSDVSINTVNDLKELSIKDVEDKLIKILNLLLGSYVNINDNFFLIGMDSMGATRFISKTNTAFKTRIQLKDFFENPTIAQIAKVVYNTIATQQEQIKIIPHAELYDTYFLQKKEYITFLIKGKNGFNTHTVIYLKNAHKPVLEKVFKTIIGRHEALRTVFVKNGKQIKQKILAYDSQKFKIEYIDISDETNKGEKANQFFQDGLNTCFDFENGPLMCIRVVKFNDDLTALLLVVHHAICDAASIEILKKEIILMYSAFIENRENPLKPLLVQIKEYANWNNELLAGSMGEQCRRFYFNKISESLMLEGLQTDSTTSYSQKIINEIRSFNKDETVFPYADAIGHIGKLNLSPVAVYIFYLDQEFTSLIKKKAANYNSSLAIFLTAAYCIAAYKINKTKTFRIDMPVTTRINEDFEQLVGWVMGDIIACLNLNEELLVKDFISYAIELIITSTYYRYYPVEKIVQDFNLPVNIIAPIQLNFIKAIDTVIENFDSAHMSEGVAYYDLACNIFERKNGMQFFIRYNLSLYSSADIEKLFDEYKNTLKKMLTSSDMILIKDL